MSFFTHTLDMIPNGVVIVDLDHKKATFSNKEIDTIFGLPMDLPTSEKLKALQEGMRTHFIYDQGEKEPET